MKWAGLWRVKGRGVGRTGFWLGQPKAVRPFWRSRRRWKNNIKIDVQEVAWEVLDWISVVQNKDKCRAVHNTVVNCRVARNAAIFLISWENAGFARRKLLLSVSEWVSDWVSYLVSCLVNIQIIVSKTTSNWRIESTAICWELLYCIHIRKEEIFCVNFKGFFIISWSWCLASHKFVQLASERDFLFCLTPVTCSPYKEGILLHYTQHLQSSSGVCKLLADLVGTSVFKTINGFYVSAQR